MERDVRRAVLLALSVPIKPGAVHRLTNDSEYEARLLEAVEILDLLAEARSRGQLLALGKIAGPEMGLGSIISRALKRAFEAGGLTPLTGLWSAAVALSAIDGYAAAANLKVAESLHVLITRVLYSTSSEDSVQVINALSDVADSDLVNYAEEKGLNEGYVSVNSLSLGDIFELLAPVDTGFMLNLRSYADLVKASKLLSTSKTIYEGVTRAYIDLAGRLLARGVVPAGSQLDARTLMNADRELRQLRPKLNRALGGLMTSIYLAAVSSSLPPLGGA